MFIDLATDLAWLTGRTLAEFVLDEHRTLSTEADTPSGLAVASLTNQSIGVLIGHGYTQSGPIANSMPGRRASTWTVTSAREPFWPNLPGRLPGGTDSWVSP
ncbi:hypothetical protein [Jatrophihabitans lederbergiae]|uniref:Uncharacterized protein n=1 Tax=Jatrophihabitans lederbergiae TaxID=3075547 RepID=A0ABU2JF45_9ACTN|nr:hypothetical protein [Jatrophihabitans sp. DSM 44399]MDT0263620.1 hypothetical protein [Jatrophihabitans sp. DSM 44399]